MPRNSDVPELLETFMDQCGETERWITVSEIREYFDLDTVSGPAISGFLSKIHRGTFFACPYRVERIERLVVETPHRRTIKRYLVRRRPFSSKKHSPGKDVPGL
ncbi:MAG TPA: hypothetical protein P5217_07305 [Methanoregulaceae archaeon]|nr:hypothetical protein [Methanoregulaceae archaeon]HPD76253.1 hypothetical protein [Methanoregulaceae archaeon]HRY76074.1 hypothetical protein [Methanoregulaceae archaeon]